MSDTKHSPTPWAVKGQWFTTPEIVGPDGRRVGYLQRDWGRNCDPADSQLRAATADAAFIVRAVNANEKLVEALEKLLKRSEQQECLHEDTRRGGAIWTICDGCGRKWADDRGGFPGYVEPAEFELARAALALAKGR